MSAASTSSRLDSSCVSRWGLVACGVAPFLCAGGWGGSLQIRSIFELVRPLIEEPDGVLQHGGAQVNVALGGGEVGVTGQWLDRDGRVALHGQVRAEGVTEDVHAPIGQIGEPKGGGRGFPSWFPRSIPPTPGTIPRTSPALPRIPHRSYPARKSPYAPRGT